MQSADVLIVGGGPAGSSCATRLRAAGLDVLVLDRAVFPRDKPCAGWITPGTLETLGLSTEEYAQGRVLQPFTAFRTGRIGGPDVVTRYGRPVSFGLRRIEFDHFLLERSGARCLTGVPVTRLRRAGDSWVVNETIRTPLVIGAGGHFCPVARFLNGPPSPRAVVVAREVEFRMDARQQSECRVRPERPELFFCSDLRGYGWCVRKGEYLNVGLGRRDSRRLPAHVTEFLAFLAQQGTIPTDVPSPCHGHTYLLYESAPRRVAADGLLLVGDAAGLAAPASGEGIRPAVESGLLAADATLAARGRFRHEDLEPYVQALRARLGPRRRRAELPAPLAGLAGRCLLGARWFARHVVLDRWFLQVDREALTEGAHEERLGNLSRDPAARRLPRAVSPSHRCAAPRAPAYTVGRPWHSR
jgi:menaquinone-9 beta-reductase